ncbi:246_t:CDS:2, partial [Cetraspora pellucida]
MEEFLNQINGGFLKKFDYGEFKNIKKISDGSSLIESAFWKNRRHVVLKFLKENCEDKYYKKFLREIRNIKNVSDENDNVIKFYGATK